MRSAHWRGMALPILCLAIAACGKPADQAKADPNAPAVVKAPPPVLASDTMKKEVPPVVSEDIARQTVLRDYALVGAGLAFRDSKLLMSFYAPDAELTTPNGTFTGKAGIIKEYESIGMDATVSEFQRQSMVLRIVDSTVVDSGVYTAVKKGNRGTTTSETGAYASVWRIHPPPMDWVMSKDHLYLPKKKAK